MKTVFASLALLASTLVTSHSYAAGCNPALAGQSNVRIEARLQSINEVSAFLDTAEAVMSDAGFSASSSRKSLTETSINVSISGGTKQTLKSDVKNQIIQSLLNKGIEAQVSVSTHGPC